MANGFKLFRLSVSCPRPLPCQLWTYLLLGQPAHPSKIDFTDPSTSPGVDDRHVYGWHILHSQRKRVTKEKAIFAIPFPQTLVHNQK